MPTTEIQGLEFEVSGNVDKASRGIGELADNLGKLKRSLNIKTEKLTALSRALDIIGESNVSGIAGLGEALKSVANAKISPTTAKQLEKISIVAGAISDDSIAKVTALSDALSGMQNASLPQVKISGNAANTSSASSSASQLGASVSNLNSVTVKVGSVTAKLSEAKNELDDVGKKTDEAFKRDKIDLFGAALNKLKSIGSRLSGLFGKLGASIKENLAESAKKATSGFTKLFSSLSRIAMYRLIRTFFSQLTSGIKEGIDNLYKYSQLMGGTFAASMDRLATSFQYLKNSMGAAASPLINALAPAIDFVINKLVSLLNIINQVFARLSGASVWTRAKKAATSYGGAVSSAGSAAKKAAKEIKDATTGIDELNIINQQDEDDTDSGSGSGGDAAGVGDMFETVPIDKKISDFIDKLKDLFKNGKWKEIGVMLGEKFNEIVDSIPWSAIGHKIGYYLNGAITIAYWFLKTADFRNLGHHLAEMFNGIFEEIDFNTLGRLLVRRWTALFDLVIGFVLGLDWGLIGRSISDTFIGMFQEANEWLDSINWVQLANGLFIRFIELVNNIDWATIGSEFSNFVLLTFGAIADVLEAIDWVVVGETLVNAFIDLVTNIDWMQVLKAIGEALYAAVNAAAGLLYGFLEPVANGLANTLGAYLEGVDLSEVGHDLIDDIWEGIKTAMANVGSWVKTNIFDPFIDGFKNAFGIHSPSTVMAEQGGFVVGGFLNGITEKMGEVLTAVVTWATNVVEWFLSGGIIESFSTHAQNVIGSFRDGITSFYTNAQSSITTWATNVKTWFTTEASETKFGDFAKNIIDAFKNKVGNYYTASREKVTTWGNKVKSWFTDKVSYSAFYNVAKDVVNGFKNGIGALYQTCADTISTWGSSIIGWFKGILQVNSPSKVFYKIGGWAIAGFNNAVKEVGTSTKTVVGDWANSFTNVRPTLSMGVDTSALASYNADDFSDSISGNVQSRVDVMASGFAEAMEDFYTEYVRPTLTQIASDTNRQANKSDTTVVSINGREIAKAVKDQQKVNGFAFT